MVANVAQRARKATAEPTRAYRGLCLPHASSILSDDRADFLRERIDRKRLGDHLHARIQEPRGQGRVLGIAGDEEDLEIGTSLACRIGQLPTVQPRQPHVGDQQDAEAVRRREAAEQAHTLEVLNRTGAAVAAELDLERIVSIVTDAGVEITGALAVRRSLALSTRIKARLPA